MPPYCQQFCKGKTFKKQKVNSEKTIHFFTFHFSLKIQISVFA